MTKEELDEGRWLLNSDDTFDGNTEAAYDWFARHADELLALAEEARWRSVVDEPPTERDGAVLAYDPKVSGYQVDAWSRHAVIEQFARNGTPTYWRPLPRFGGE